MPRDYHLYLDDIIEAASRIREFTEGMSFEDFAGDRKTQDAVIRNLEIIGEAARAIPDDIKLQADTIEWRKITGLRNLLIHEYFGVNLSIVWDIIANKLAPLSHACSKLSCEP